MSSDSVALVSSEVKFPEVPGVEFRLVAGFPAYCVGNDGTVWSRAGRSGRPGVSDGGTISIILPTWRKLKPEVGISATRIRFPLGSRKKAMAVHRVVLESFGFPRPKGLECRHLNGNFMDNRLENLVWGTGKENADDSLRHGTRIMGSRHWAAKFTEEQIVKIRNGYLPIRGFQTRLAEKNGVSKQTIHQILNRRTWRHIP